jgi:ribosomal protein S17E
MGRIKTKKIKRATVRVMKEADFSQSFDDNKKILSSVAKTYSKKIRNIIAGYATKLTKRKNAQA